MVSTCICYDFLNDYVYVHRIIFLFCSPPELIVRWAQDSYEFLESELITVELVTESDFEVPQVSIQGGPRRIPDSDHTSRPSLVLLGPHNFSGNGESKLNGAALVCSFFET